MGFWELGQLTAFSGQCGSQKCLFCNQVFFGTPFDGLCRAQVIKHHIVVLYAFQLIKSSSHRSTNSKLAIILMLGGVSPPGSISNSIGGTIFNICDVPAFLPLPLDSHRISS